MFDSGAGGCGFSVRDVGDVAADEGAVLSPDPIDESPAGTQVVERVELVVPSAGCSDRRGRDPGAGEPVPAGVYDRSWPGGGVLAVAADPQPVPARVRVPSARAAGLAELVIVVDAHERYRYDFADEPVTTVRRGLSCGDYGLSSTAG